MNEVITTEFTEREKMFFRALRGDKNVSWFLAPHSMTAENSNYQTNEKEPGLKMQVGLKVIVCCWKAADALLNFMPRVRQGGMSLPVRR